MIRWAEDALGDLERVHTWLLLRDEASAAHFVALLKKTEARIAHRPMQFPAASAGAARKCLMRLGRSVYVIYFAPDGEDQIIRRLWHGREAKF